MKLHATMGGGPMGRQRRNQTLNPIQPLYRPRQSTPRRGNTAAACLSNPGGVTERAPAKYQAMPNSNTIPEKYTNARPNADSHQHSE
jgi:hypothetical protein